MHEPWATAIALGAKRIETRGWKTSYRGPLAIHAGMRQVTQEIVAFSASWPWCGVVGMAMGAGPAEMLLRLSPGRVVATCTLADCVPTGSLKGEVLDAERGSAPYTWTERMLGNFALGRYGWILTNLRSLEQPITARGAQGLWEWEAPDWLDAPEIST